MVLSALSFSIMAALVKANLHSVAVKAFSRQLISCFIVLIIIVINNYRIIPLKKSRVKLLLRCFFGTLGIYLYFYSIDNLLLANASMLTRLSPFFVTLFAFLILKESVKKVNWLVFFPMLIGCVLIIKPNSELFNPASIYAVLSACSGALAYIMIKSIGRNEYSYTIIFWFSLVSSFIYLLVALDEFKFIDLISILNLVMIGVFGLIGQIGLTKSYQISKASHIAPYSYLYVVFSGLIGFFIWNEIPDKISLLGYFLIITSYLCLIKIKDNNNE